MVLPVSPNLEKPLKSMLHSVEKTTIKMVIPNEENPCLFKKVIKNPNPPINIMLISSISEKKNILIEIVV